MAFRLQQLRSKAVVSAQFAAKQLIGNGQHSVVNPPLMESPKQLFFSRFARNNSNGLGFSRGIHFSAPLSKRESNSSDIFSYMGGLNGEQTQLIKKLVNFRMIGGKKTKVRHIVYQTLQRAARNDSDVVKLLTSSIENIKPICEVQKVGSRGFSHSVPWVVPRERQLTLAIRWIYDAAEKRRTSKRIGLDKCLFSEVLDAHKKKGAARKKRETVHGIASANRSFAHYRWW